jgi:hypothetical protein
MSMRRFVVEFRRERGKESPGWDIRDKNKHAKNRK